MPQPVREILGGLAHHSIQISPQSPPTSLSRRQNDFSHHPRNNQIWQWAPPLPRVQAKSQIDLRKGTDTVQEGFAKLDRYGPRENHSHLCTRRTQNPKSNSLEQKSKFQPGSSATKPRPRANRNQDPTTCRSHGRTPYDNL